MNKYLKKWLVGLIVGVMGTALVWWGYRGIGAPLAWAGWGIAAYGIGSGLLERIKQARKK